MTDETDRAGRPVRTDWVAWGALALLSVVWGSTFVLTELALPGFGPAGVAGGRLFLAAAFMTAVTIALGRALPGRLVDWVWCGGVGICSLALPFTLIAYAQQTVASSIAAIYITGAPLLVLVLLWLFRLERVAARAWAGFAVGLFGLGWLSGPHRLVEIGGGGLAELALLAAALSFAFGTILIRQMPRLDPVGATAASQIVGAVVLLPSGLPALASAAAPGWIAVAALLVLGVVQTGAAQFLRYFTVKRAGAVFTSTVSYLIPIWAGFLGITILGEEVTLRALSAYALILAGLVLARNRPIEGT